MLSHQGNTGLEALMVERVRQQVFRRMVGGGDQQHAVAEQLCQQRLNQHSVADIMQMELVEAEQPTAADAGGNRRVNAAACGDSLV